MKETNKLTLGQTVHIKVAHSVSTLTNSQGHRWLSNARLTHYQGLLCENPRVTTETVRGLNPATFLPREEGAPATTDSPISKADLNLLTDGNSYIQNGERYEGHAITTATEVTEAAPLPTGWSAQWAELYALIQALCHAENKVANIYTDSKYAFATIHIDGAI
ncbi:Gag-Pol polyprotein [Plecturocebus cupreus]